MGNPHQIACDGWLRAPFVADELKRSPPLVRFITSECGRTRSCPCWRRAWVPERGSGRETRLVEHDSGLGGVSAVGGVAEFSGDNQSLSPLACG